MADSIGFSLTTPWFRQFATESTHYDWWHHQNETIGVGMWRNGFSGNELNPFGSHQETKQQLQLKHVDSQDDLQVYDEPYRRSLNFQFLEPGYKVAQESSSDNEQFQINETHSA